MPSFLGFLSRKKKTTTRTDDTRSQLEKAGISAQDMPTDTERQNKKTVLTGKTDSRPADPNVPAENMAALATAAMKAMGKDPDEEKKKKKAQGK
jgi:hypothetical protein